MKQNKDHITLAKEASKSLPHAVYVDPNLRRIIWEDDEKSGACISGNDLASQSVSAGSSPALPTNITFDQFKETFYHQILLTKQPFIRKGQALMNYLFVVWPKEWHRISHGESKNDCFYVDSRITNTMLELEAVWYNYPN
jgi:hypothetical protein